MRSKLELIKKIGQWALKYWAPVTHKSINEDWDWDRPVFVEEETPSAKSEEVFKKYDYVFLCWESCPQYENNHIWINGKNYAVSRKRKEGSIAIYASVAYIFLAMRPEMHVCAFSSGGAKGELDFHLCSAWDHVDEVGLKFLVLLSQQNLDEDMFCVLPLYLTKI